MITSIQSSSRKVKKGSNEIKIINGLERNLNQGEDKVGDIITGSPKQDYCV